MQAELIVLRLLHILGGMFWVGAGLFNTIFLMPAMRGAGPAAGPVVAGLQERKMFTVLPGVALVTILTGMRLLWIVSGGFDHGYLASPSGSAFAASGAAALLAFVFGMLVMRPATMKAATLAPRIAGMPPGAERRSSERELASLQRRAGAWSVIVHVLLVAGAAGMAVARYIG